MDDLPKMMLKASVPARFCRRIGCVYLAGDVCGFGGQTCRECKLSHIEYRDICLLQAKGML